MVTLVGYAYLLCMNVSKHPLGGLWVIPDVFVYLMGVVALLNISLYFRKMFSIYLGDFLAISLVSCMVKMVGLV